MAVFNFQTVKSTAPYGFKRVVSSTMTPNFLGLEIGTDLLPISQGGSGAGAYFNFGTRGLKTSFAPVSGDDLVNLTALNNAISELGTGVEWQDSVLSRLATPPGSPVSGDRHLIIATATGVWAGKEDQIAEWSGSAWTYTTPSTGMAILVDDEPTKLWIFGTTTWGSKSFESTTASGYLSKVGDDIRLSNLTSGRIFLGNSSNEAVDVAISGDVLLSNTGVATIQTNAVTTTKINDSAVTSSKIGTGAVGSGHIASQAVTKEKIAADVAGEGLRQAANGSLERNDDLSATNSTGGVIAAKAVVILSAGGTLTVASKATAPERGVYAMAVAAINDTEAGLVKFRTGSVFKNFATGTLTPGREYYLGATGNIDLPENLTFAAGDKVVVIGKAVNSNDLELIGDTKYEY